MASILDTFKLSAEPTKAVADEAMGELQAILKGDFAKLSEADVALVETIVTDLAHLSLLAATSPADNAFKDEVAQLIAQTANIAAARELRLGNAIGRSVSNVLTRGLQVAFAALPLTARN